MYVQCNDCIIIFYNSCLAVFRQANQYHKMLNSWIFYPVTAWFTYSVQLTSFLDKGSTKKSPVGISVV